MARNKFQNKKGGMPLFPDVHYISERKGARLSKKQKLMATAVTGREKDGYVDLDASEPTSLKPKSAQKSLFEKIPLRVKQVGIGVIAIAVMAMAFAPTM